MGEISMDNLWIKLGKPRFSSKDRSDATGQSFDRKANFLVRQKHLSGAEAGFAKTCHKYRNELYHTGLRYEDILWELSFAYCELALTLYKTVNPNDSYYSGSPTSEAVLKHTEGKPFRVMQDVNFICESLRKELPTQSSSLAATLSKSAVDRVDEIRTNFDFLISNDPHKRDRVTSLLDLQLSDYLSSNDSLVEAVIENVHTEKQMKAALSYLGSVWRPRYRKDPCSSWEAKARKIAAYPSPIRALDAFERFRADIVYLARIIDDAAAALDEQISLAMDIARGK